MVSEMGGWPSGQWQQTVNLPSFEFEGSNPSPPIFKFAQVAQLAEHILGKDEVRSSNLLLGLLEAVLQQKNSIFN
jgi:hypothetical protein